MINKHEHVASPCVVCLCGVGCICLGLRERLPAPQRTMAPISEQRSEQSSPVEESDTRRERERERDESERTSVVCASLYGHLSISIRQHNCGSRAIQHIFIHTQVFSATSGGGDRQVAGGRRHGAFAGKIQNRQTISSTTRRRKVHERCGRGEEEKTKTKRRKRRPHKQRSRKRLRAKFLGIT